MGFLGKIFGKKSHDVAGVVDTGVNAVNNAVDQVQAAVPGTTGDAMVDQVQQQASDAAQQVTGALGSEQSPPAAAQPSTASSDGVVPAPVQQPEATEQPQQQPPQSPGV